MVANDVIVYFYKFVKIIIYERGEFEMNIHKLSERFYHFADECKGSSELYEFLSLQIAKDEEVLRLSSYAQTGQPIPNLLFGAVHYLLLQGKKHILREYYSSLVDHPRPIETIFTPFKDFCQTYDKEIIKILQTKLVQTNEVRRCAYLYPAFCYMYEKVKRPLALIEIGTSAGLQLLFDKYSYSYGDKNVYGNVNSTLHITSRIITQQSPRFHQTAPPVTDRIGFDLHVNNVKDAEDYLWLKALIWPNHQERRELFEKAATYVKENQLQLIEGDGITLLPNVVEKISEASVICIFHTHVANQIPKDAKLKLVHMIKKIGMNRDVFHLYNNMFDGELHLDCFINGREAKKTIGKTDGHGRWFEWKFV